jgi:hypothetical protein
VESQINVHHFKEMEGDFIGISNLSEIESDERTFHWLADDPQIDSFAVEADLSQKVRSLKYEEQGNAKRCKKEYTKPVDAVGFGIIVSILLHFDASRSVVDLIRDGRGRILNSNNQAYKRHHLFAVRFTFANLLDSDWDDGVVFTSRLNRRRSSRRAKKRRSHLLS